MASCNRAASSAVYRWCKHMFKMLEHLKKMTWLSWSFREASPGSRSIKTFRHRVSIPSCDSPTLPLNPARGIPTPKSWTRLRGVTPSLCMGRNRPWLHTCTCLCTQKKTGWASDRRHRGLSGENTFHALPAMHFGHIGQQQR